MKLVTIPISEVVRPRGSREEAGQHGELLHQLADWLAREVDESMADAFTFTATPTVGEVREALEVVVAATKDRFPAERFAPVRARLAARPATALYESPLKRP